MTISHATFAQLVLCGCLVGLATAAGASVQSEQGLQGARRPAGLTSIKLAKGLQVRPDVPLQLMLAPGGAAKSGIVGDPAGSIRAQQWKGHIRAVVRSPIFGTYVVQEAPDGTSKITQIDPDSLGGCETDTIMPPSPAIGIDGDDGAGETGTPDGDAPPADGDAEAVSGTGPVDVFVAYTNLARANAGSTEAMETAIHGWINESNDVYRDSDTVVRIRLVGTGEVSYYESGSFSNHLSRLAGTSDGYMDEVHTWRNDTGADVVMLIVEDSGSCGLGYTIKNDSTGVPTYAFAVVRDYCADIQYSFTHELGHVLGCCHDADHPGSCAGGNSLYTYSFGHRFVGDTGNWRSIMAYTDSSSDPLPQVSYTRVGHLSNPDIEYDGQWTGTALADNANTHDSMSVVTAGYRAALAPMSCLGDVQNDAEVGVADLLGLLGVWGPLAAGNDVSEASDLNGDATIDVSDLLILLMEFGPCPS